MFTDLSNLDILKKDLIPLKINQGTEMEKYYTEHYVTYER